MLSQAFPAICWGRPPPRSGRQTTPKRSPSSSTSRVRSCRSRPGGETVLISAAKENVMQDHSTTAQANQGPLPADDPDRKLTLTDPDDAQVRRISIVGNTYTILVSGHETRGRYCLIDMLVPRRRRASAAPTRFRRAVLAAGRRARIHFPWQDADSQGAGEPQHPCQRTPPIQEHIGHDRSHALHVHARGPRRVFHGGRRPHCEPRRPSAEARQGRASRKRQARPATGSQISDRAAGQGLIKWSEHLRGPRAMHAQ